MATKNFGPEMSDGMWIKHWADFGAAVSKMASGEQPGFVEPQNVAAESRLAELTKRIGEGEAVLAEHAKLKAAIAQALGERAGQ